MNSHTLRIQAQDQPTVMEKLLQVSRYRGFNVTGMTMFPVTGEQGLEIVLSVQSEQPVAQLTNQLAKLIDIDEISVDNDCLSQCRA